MFAVQDGIFDFDSRKIISTADPFANRGFSFAVYANSTAIGFQEVVIQSG
jgi:hypothetical protein